MLTNWSVVNKVHLLIVWSCSRYEWDYTTASNWTISRRQQVWWRHTCLVLLLILRVEVRACWGLPHSLHIPDVKCYSSIFDRVQVQNISLSDSEFLDFYFIRFYFCKQISMTMKHTVILLHATTHINHSFKGNGKLSNRCFFHFFQIHFFDREISNSLW